jgi:hypothetical protein
MELINNEMKDEHLAKRIEELTETLNKYIKEDGEWKERAEPVVKFYENMAFTNKALIYVLQVIAYVGGAIGIAYAAIRYLK